MVRLFGFPKRRWLIAVALVLPLTWLFASGATGPALRWEAPFAVADAVLAAAVLGSYAPAPGTGRRLDVGCAPCARVAALTVIAAVAARAADPASIGLAVFSLVALGFGLLQRLSDGPACAVAPASPR